MTENEILNFSEVIEALMFASDAHKHQRRKGSGGSPYINHLIEVTSLLSNVANVTDTEILIAATLHDILEDTDITEKDLTEKFGKNVVDYVKSVTDDKTLSLDERRKKQLKAVTNSSDATKLIKLADHCSNVASIPDGWEEKRIKSYLAWSETVARECFATSSLLADEYRKRLFIASDSVYSDA